MGEQAGTSDEATSAAQYAALEVLDVPTVNAVLREAAQGQFIVYLSCEPVNIPSTHFLGVCISFHAPGAEACHNLAFRCAAPRGAWAAFKDWVTIHPAPWEEDDAADVLQSNMLFPSLEKMCQALPELRERVYAPALPSGWEVRYSKTKMRSYWYKRATKQSTTPQVAEYTIPSQETVEEEVDLERTRHVLDTEGGGLIDGTGVEVRVDVDGSELAVVPTDASAAGAFLPPTQAVVSSRSGIGVSLARGDDGSVLVEKISSDSPAQASIEVNDQIERVDLKNVVGLDLKDVVRLLRGPAGSQVSLRICRRVERESGAALMRFSTVVRRRDRQSRDGDMAEQASSAAGTAFPAPAISMEALAQVFATLDTNQDGKLSHAEFIRGLKKHPEIANLMGMPASIQQEDGTRDKYQLAFGEMDADGSKSIELPELWHFFGHTDVSVTYTEGQISRTRPPADSLASRDVAQRQGAASGKVPVPVGAKTPSPSPKGSTRSLLPDALVLRNKKHDQESSALEQKLFESRERLRRERETITCAAASWAVLALPMPTQSQHGATALEEVRNKADQEASALERTPAESRERLGKQYATTSSAAATSTVLTRAMPVENQHAAAASVSLSALTADNSTALFTRQLPRTPSEEANIYQETLPGSLTTEGPNADAARYRQEDAGQLHAMLHRPSPTPHARPVSRVREVGQGGDGALSDAVMVADEAPDSIVDTLLGLQKELEDARLAIESGASLAGGIDPQDQEIEALIAEYMYARLPTADARRPQVDGIIADYMGTLGESETVALRKERGQE